VIRSFAGQASVSGGALLIAGEPGIGKTALLDAVATEAEAAGTKILRAAGVEYEAGISYAGLNLALLPLAASIPLLDSAHRDALRVVFGLDVAVTPDRHTVCNAFLELLRRESADRAVLLLVDDLQWLDPLSAVVFGFVARRAAGGRVGLIGTIRSGGEGFFDRARLAGHELAPLSESASAELLHRRFPLSTAGCGTGCWPTRGGTRWHSWSCRRPLATSVAANGFKRHSGRGLPSSQP
jgi:predicted ATPase